MSAGLFSGWAGLSIAAVILAACVSVFAKVALSGLSAPFTVMVSFLTMLVVSFTTLSFNGFVGSARGFSASSVRDIAICGVLAALGYTFLCMALQGIMLVSAAPFYLLVPVFVFVAQAVYQKKLASLPSIALYAAISVGVLLMGFGIHHKNSLWWLYALLGPLFLAAESFYSQVRPLDSLQQTAELFVIVIVSLVLSFFIKHKALKNITAYHVFFAILAGIALYYAPRALSRALSLGPYDIWISFFYSLWLVLSVLIARLAFKEKLSAVTFTGLCVIVASYSVRFALAHFI